MLSYKDWNQEEIKVFYELYQKFGSKVTAKKLGRSESSVQTKAHELGVKFIGLSNYDINIIKKYYFMHSSKWIQENYLNDVPVATIRSYANKIGLYSNFRNWSKKEDLYLIENYNSISTDKIANYLHRDEKSVMRRTSKLGLKSIKRWTKEEVEILIKYYPIEGKKCSRRLPNKTEKQCQEKANKLHLIS